MVSRAGWLCLLVLLQIVMAAELGRAGAAATDMLVAVTRAHDLTFPTEATALSVTNPRMGLYKPPGDGPFPAVVLVPHCNGLGSLGGYPNLSIGRWAKEMLDHGYVVLLIDSQGARGVDSTCMEPKAAVYHIRGALDVLQASAFLRTLNYVDKRRIAVVGFSWGAMANLLAASKFNQSALKADIGFAAFVAVYPLCAAFLGPQGRPYEIARRDLDRPGLVLLGGEDSEAPANLCVSKLRAAALQGAPVEWHIFPHATHCWDCAHLDGYSKIDFRGTSVEYRFDSDVTADTKRRIFAFLGRVWAGGK